MAIRTSKNDSQNPLNMQMNASTHRSINKSLGQENQMTCKEKGQRRYVNSNQYSRQSKEGQRNYKSDAREIVSNSTRISNNQFINHLGDSATFERSLNEQSNYYSHKRSTTESNVVMLFNKQNINVCVPENIIDGTIHHQSLINTNIDAGSASIGNKKSGSSSNRAANTNIELYKVIYSPSQSRRSQASAKGEPIYSNSQSHNSSYPESLSIKVKIATSKHLANLDLSQTDFKSNRTNTSINLATSNIKSPQRAYIEEQSPQKPALAEKSRS